MANALYGLGVNSYLTKALSWTADTIKVVLARTDAGHYTVAINTDQYLSAIASGDRVATSAALSGASATLGVANASNVTISAVTGTQVGAIVIYHDTGVAGTSDLEAYIDTVANGALPYTPSGADVTISWDTGANKIFKL